MPYLIQGQSPPLPREPVEMNGTVYVPLKDLTETLGGTVDHEDDNDTWTATIARWTATVPLETNRAEVNGEPISFSAPTVNQDGNIWVPADFFHSVFGYDVQASGTSVEITNPNAEAVAVST